jgi:uncharacterized membrane protein
MTGPHGRPGSPQTPSPPEPSMESLAVSGHHRRQLSPEEMAAMEEKIRKVEVAISLVLRVGVSLSVLVIAVGLGLMFAHHSEYGAITGHFSYKALTSKSTQFPHTFGSLGRSLARGDGRGVVVLGVLLLILTPVLRVAVGVLSFIYEKDPPMTLITLYVLAVLIGSFFLAGA